MNFVDALLNGIISGLGMTIVMTLFGFLTFKLTKNWITKTITEIWAKVKQEGIKLDGIKIDGSLETTKVKKRKFRKDKKQ